MKLKIAIVVHGRFHAFDLARALLRRGHDVTLFTIGRGGRSNDSTSRRAGYAVSGYMV
jgi:UDP:flavonoid glycosyltransferase YjiC (YdhE family)